VREAGAADLGALLAAARSAARHAPGTRLYLVGATSHLAEGWRARVARFDLAMGGAADAVVAAVEAAAAALGFPVTWESPADVIPLPAGWEARARPVPVALAEGGPPEILHFDPYSVVLRLVARGDEPDYLAALEYLRHGWVERERLEAALAEVLPRCTRETLAQDPAEFRRKFKGLRQLAAWDATRTAHPDKLDRDSHRLHTRPGS
jgi:hypothetical protein